MLDETHRVSIECAARVADVCGRKDRESWGNPRARCQDAHLVPVCPSATWAIQPCRNKVRAQACSSAEAAKLYARRSLRRFLLTLGWSSPTCFSGCVPGAFQEALAPVVTADCTFKIWRLLRMASAFPGLDAACRRGLFLFLPRYWQADAASAIVRTSFWHHSRPNKLAGPTFCVTVGSANAIPFPS